MEAPSSPASTYELLRVEFIDLARRLGRDDLDRVVAPTPDWTVHDVLAHVVGITADLNASDFGPGDPDAWTARQVAVRRDRTVEQLAEEWDAEAPMFEEGLTLFGDEIGKHYVGDLAQHFIDVQGALGQPASIAPEALLAGLDFYLEDLDERLLAHDTGVELEVDGRSFSLGRTPPTARARVSALEAFRVIGGRRSLAQIEALSWEGDPGPLLTLLSAYRLPAADLEL